MIAGLWQFRGRRREQTGLVLKDGLGRIRVQRVPNRSPEPDRALVFYADIRVKAPWVIIGFLHTHTDRGDSEPSPYDIENMPTGPSAIPSVVYCPLSGTLVWYSSKGVFRRETLPRRSKVSRTQPREKQKWRVPRSRSSP